MSSDEFPLQDRICYTLSYMYDPGFPSDRQNPPWARRFRVDFSERAYYLKDEFKEIPEGPYSTIEKAEQVAKLYWGAWVTMDPIVLLCKGLKIVPEVLTQYDRIVWLRFADWTIRPGGRTRDLGSFSGEAYLEEVLIPAFELAQEREVLLCLNLDGVYGYAASFLDEVFAGLTKKFSGAVVLNTLSLVCLESPETVLEIRGFILEASNP